MMSKEERRAYDDYLAYLGQELGILDTAREEKAIEIAKKLLDVGDSIEKVQIVTELPLSTIQKLAKELGL